MATQCNTRPPRVALRADGAIPVGSGAPLMLSGGVFVSPGALIGSRRADQQIHIGAFDDHDSIDDHQTRFACRAEVTGKIGVRPVPNINVGVQDRFIH